MRERNAIFIPLVRPGECDGLGHLDIIFKPDGAESPIFLAQFLRRTR